jgi:tetratricopeptide (TPR) repeat protein
MSSSQTPETIQNNILKIVDENNLFNGTGFVVEIKENRYCITCHHCVCGLNEIYGAREDTRCRLQWVEKLSAPDKDIAVLKVIDCKNGIRALQYAREAMPRLPVSVWGFSFKDLDVFPHGSPVEGGILSSTDIFFHWPQESVKKINKWNTKPEVKVYVFRFLGKFDVGFSGGPVCYTGNHNVIGIFTAKDDSYGYIIPIQTILERFDKKHRTSAPSVALNNSSILDRGNKYIDKGEFEKAIECFKQITHDPNYLLAFFNEGLAFESLKRYNEALECYDRVLNIDPNDIEARFNKGSILLDKKEFLKSIACFDKILAVSPNDAPSWVNKGFAHYMLRESDEAISCYDKALGIDPNDPDAWNNKGYLLYDLHQYDNAIWCYDKALKIEPTYAHVWRNKGLALVSLGKYKDAIEQYDKALSIDPNYDQAIEGKEEALEKLRK